MIGLTDLMGFPLPKEDSQARENLARGKSLKEVYPEDYPDSEIQEVEIKTPGPRPEENKGIDYYNPSDILKHISPLGEASLDFKVTSSNLGNYDEESYFLDLYSRGKLQSQESLGSFDRTQQPPTEQAILKEVESFLAQDYELIAQGSNLNILGYKSDEAKLGCMKSIIHKLDSKEQIPLMRNYLIKYFPKSNYGPGEEHDLSRVSATAVAIQFNHKYHQVRRKVEAKKTP